MKKKLILPAALFAAVLLPLSVFMYKGSNAQAAVDEAAASEQVDWREDYAYSMGVAAMHYAYPYWRMAHVRYDWTMKEVTPSASAVTPNGALNRFWHASLLTNADWKDGGAPNNDTLYSMAWLHVTDEPVILSVPPMDRYYTFELSGFDSDNFAYVGELSHGRQGGDYALLPKGWKGDLPEGVSAVAEAPSPWVLVIGRTYVAGEEDIPAVRALQQQYKWRFLSQFGQEEASPPQPEVFKPYDKSVTSIDDPMAVWKTINRALTENPPVSGETALMSFFREINVGPNFDVDALDDASKRGLARAAVDGFKQIQRMQMSGAGSAVLKSNGWIYSLELGRSGLNGDFATRTLHQSYSGIVANDAEEAIYFGGFVGSDGQRLQGSKRYQINMPAGTEPDVNAFWSITMYGPDTNMVANEIDRYAIGDRTPNLVRGADGSLSLLLQSERPDQLDSNWLPTPEGPFWLVLRAYLPGESMMKGEWQPPVISVVE